VQDDCTILDSCLFSALNDDSVSFSRRKRLDLSARSRWFSLTISAQVSFGFALVALPCASAVRRVTVWRSVAFSSTWRADSCCSAASCFFKLCTWNNNTNKVVSPRQPPSATSVSTDWLTCGFMSHSTQNRSFRWRSSSQSLGLVWKN